MAGHVEIGRGLRRRLMALTVVVLASAAIPGGPLERAVGGEAEAAPSATQRIFSQDRTIRPRRFVATKVFCPGRYIPFTWGFRPINPPIAGVSVNAVLTSVVPDRKGSKKAGFTITLFNPNQGATVQMRVSTTCVEGKGGVRTRSRAGAGAAKQKPQVSIDTRKRKLSIPAKMRVTKRVFCDRKTNTEVTDIGYKSRASELIGFRRIERNGVPGALIAVQNRSAVDDRGKAYVNCAEAKRFGLSDSATAPTARQARAAAAGERVPLAQRGTIAAKSGLDFNLTRFSGEADPADPVVFTGFCGQPLPAPSVSAIAGGSEFEIGATSGPASEQFLLARQAPIGLDVTLPRKAEASVLDGTLLQLHFLDLVNLEPAVATVKKAIACVKGTGGTETRVDNKTDDVIDFG